VKLYYGVDPGHDGAIAIVDQNGKVVDLRPMPLITGKDRDEFDLPAICDALIGLHPDKTRFVTVERSQPLPKGMGGGIANFARGVARGFAWMLTALRIPYQLVSPQTWQREMHTGTMGEDTKQKSIVAAQRLFPGVSLIRTARSKKAHDGFADALLLAEFGRRRETQTNTPPLPSIAAPERFARRCPQHEFELSGDDQLWCPAGHGVRIWEVWDRHTNTVVETSRLNRDAPGHLGEGPERRHRVVRDEDIHHAHDGKQEETV